jgi:hypothetical protein
MTQNEASPSSASAAESAAAPAPSAGPPSNRKRFDVFVIDTGWKSAVADMLRSNLELLKQYQGRYNLFLLTGAQCAHLARIHPSVLGNEPSVLVIDREAHAANRPQGFGFKLNLGMIRDVTTASSILKWVLAVVAEQTPGSDITVPIRTVLHKEGIRGAIDILADVTRSPFGEAATH